MMMVKLEVALVAMEAAEWMHELGVRSDYEFGVVVEVAVEVKGKAPCVVVVWSFCVGSGMCKSGGPFDDSE